MKQVKRLVIQKARQISGRHRVGLLEIEMKDVVLLAEVDGNCGCAVVTEMWLRYIKAVGSSTVSGDWYYP